MISEKTEKMVLLLCILVYIFTFANGIARGVETWGNAVIYDHYDILHKFCFHYFLPT